MGGGSETAHFPIPMPLPTPSPNIHTTATLNAVKHLFIIFQPHLHTLPAFQHCMCKLRGPGDKARIYIVMTKIQLGHLAGSTWLFKGMLIYTKYTVDLH